MSHEMSSLMLHDKQSLVIFDNPTRETMIHEMSSLMLHDKQSLEVFAEMWKISENTVKSTH
jgi:hypothetical protein